MARGPGPIICPFGFASSRSVRRYTCDSLHRRASRGPKRRAKGSTSAQTDVTTATHDTPIPIMHGRTLTFIRACTHPRCLTWRERICNRRTMHARPRNLTCFTASAQHYTCMAARGTWHASQRPHSSDPCRRARGSPSHVSEGHACARHGARPLRIRDASGSPQRRRRAVRALRRDLRRRDLRRPRPDR